jgi:hypothetical protein
LTNKHIRDSSHLTDHVNFKFYEPTPRLVESKTWRQKFDNSSLKKVKYQLHNLKDLITISYFFKFLVSGEPS